MTQDHFGPLPTAEGEFPTRRGKFIDVEILGGLVTGGTTVGTDFISTDWDGAIPPSLGSKDAGASAGFALDGSEGAAQFQKIFADGATITNISADNITAGTLNIARIGAQSITAAEILNGTVTATQIANGTITTTQIAANTIVAGDIAVDTITASEIAAGAIDTSELAAGAVTAVEITAGTITTDRLVVGSNDNLLQDTHFKNSTAWTIVVSGGGTWSFNNGGGFGSELRFTPPSSSDATLYATDVACNVGDVYYAEILVYCGGASVGTARIKTSERKGDGSYNSQITEATQDLSASSGWETISLSHTITANDTELIRYEVQVDSGATIASNVPFTRALMRRKAGTVIIEDQAVDIVRMLDPVFAATVVKTAAVTMTTSKTTLVSETFTVPAWVGTLSVFAAAQINLGAGGATQDFLIAAEIVSTTGVFAWKRNIGNKITLNSNFTKTIISPGSTVEVRTTGSTETSSQGSVTAYINAIATGVR